MDNEVFKPKMRISLLSDKGIILSDRLVDAYTEMNTGPKVVHNGPVRVEVTLSNSQDVENFKKYLDKLSGNLPIKVPAKVGRKPSTAVPKMENPREEILTDVTNMVKEGKN